ncbi:MAG TPA: zinc ribbon domain-containing protein [Ktedonobacteraceae bacterium]|jgi:NAD-dependent dihydropyrimidine dehydrogenase PreA subunit|nr:zinc ribbon domain-containing protein [Ktedonobacteraceae bacterium]
MLLCKKIKVEVSEQDAATLEFMQSKCRALYNWQVMHLRDGEQWHFAEAKRSLQQSKQYDPELEYVYGKLLADVYKRQLYGKDLQFIDERNTSKMCSGCGHLRKMPLWKRTYCCVECGLIMDRNENSAVNILMRFIARRGPYTQRECGVLHEDQNSVEVIEASCPVQVQ